MQGLKSRINSIECRSLYSRPPEVLTPGFVTILDRVEQVHLRKPAFRRTFDYVA
ncbi:hypothetical protein [Microcoleus sp. Pol17_C1]|uniref:hypothetical protein n=1 Tax=unclassified Microcoleus TaxID=2642155 RepID=UPI002FD0F576